MIMDAISEVSYDVYRSPVSEDAGDLFSHLTPCPPSLRGKGGLIVYIVGEVREKGKPMGYLVAGGRSSSMGEDKKGLSSSFTSYL